MMINWPHWTVASRVCLPNNGKIHLEELLYHLLYCASYLTSSTSLCFLFVHLANNGKCAHRVCWTWHDHHLLLCNTVAVITQNTVLHFYVFMTTPVTSSLFYHLKCRLVWISLKWLLIFCIKKWREKSAQIGESKKASALNKWASTWQLWTVVVA